LLFHLGCGKSLHISKLIIAYVRNSCSSCIQIVTIS
jgi:hypothetical protein